MNRAVTALLIALTLMSTLTGCGDAAVDVRGQRVAVAGKVFLDGSPLSRARVLFISDEGSGTKSSWKPFTSVKSVLPTPLTFVKRR